MARTRTYHPGIIELGKKVIISDPSYEPGIWCCREAEILPGKYECSVRRNKLKTWGDRSVSVRIQHMDYPDVKCNIDLLFIGVDSGQAGIFPEEYFKKHCKDDDYDAEPHSWYRKICDQTLEKDWGEIDDRCVVSSAGTGDGAYPVFVKWDKETEKITQIKIQFL